MCIRDSDATGAPSATRSDAPYRRSCEKCMTPHSLRRVLRQAATMRAVEEEAAAFGVLRTRACVRCGRLVGAGVVPHGCVWRRLGQKNSLRTLATVFRARRECSRDQRPPRRLMSVDSTIGLAKPSRATTSMARARRSLVVTWRGDSCANGAAIGRISVYTALYHTSPSPRDS